VAALLLVGVGAAAAGCGSVPRRHYFTLTFPMEAPETRAPLHPYRLRIRPFKVALPYDRPQIVFRQSPYQYEYYAFKMWAAKPQHLLRELVERHLDAVRLTESVTRDFGEQLPDYELGADVLAIEEFDSGDVWYGHLAMRFELVRFADKVPVWTYAFDRKVPVYERDLIYVVRALSELAEEELLQVTAGLDQYFAEVRAVPQTLTAPPTRGMDGAGRGGRDPGSADLILPEEEPGSGAPGPAARPVPLIVPEEEP